MHAFPDLPMEVVMRIYTSKFSLVRYSKKTQNRLRKKMESISYEMFLNSTQAQFVILGCRFTTFDCTTKWQPVLTKYGMCMVFEAKKYFPAPSVAFARQAQLSFMAFYNASDSVGGFNQLLNGLVWIVLLLLIL